MRVAAFWLRTAIASLAAGLAGVGTSPAVAAAPDARPVIDQMISTAGPSQSDDVDSRNQDDRKPTKTVALSRPLRCCPPCYHPYICPRPQDEGKAAPSKAAPGEAAPGETAPAETPSAEEPTPSLNALAGTVGGAAGPMSAAPNMIGDQFGGGHGRASIVRLFTFNNLTSQGGAPGSFYTILPNGTRVALNAVVVEGNTFPVLDYNDVTGKLGGLPLSSVPGNGTLVDGTSALNPQTEDYDTTFRVRYDIIDLPSPGTGGVVGRTKIAENTSPIPRDRLFFNYSFFDGVPLFPGGVDVNRFTPGFEKTLLDGWMSFEMRFPMATTLDSTIVDGGVTSTSHGEFGDIAVTFKSLVLRRETLVISGGIMVAVPTADDTLLVLPDGTPLVAVRNRATHLGPFLGWLWTPNDRFFAQGFLQWDVGANGNPVLINELQGAGLTHVGELNDATFQYVDVGVGSWLYRGSASCRRLTGLAWTAELHWTRSLQSTDIVSAGLFRVGDFRDNIDELNITIGAHIELCDKTTVTAGYSCPLTGGSDREFNGELRLLLNRRFGPQNRMVATPPL